MTAENTTEQRRALARAGTLGFCSARNNETFIHEPETQRPSHCSAGTSEPEQAEQTAFEICSVVPPPYSTAERNNSGTLTPPPGVEGYLDPEDLAYLEEERAGLMADAKMEASLAAGRVTPLASHLLELVHPSLRHLVAEPGRARKPKERIAP